MKKIVSLFATALAAISLSAGELTVADGTSTHDKLPVYPFYGDVSGVRSQMIYPASLIESMQGGTVTAISFYTGNQASKAMTTVYTVRLAVTEQGEFANSSYLEAEGTTVYEGTIDASQTVVTIELATPFTYEEGNLLLDIQTQQTGNYADAEFSGVTTTVNSAIYHTTYGSQNAKFLPKTTFVYDEPSGVTCARPSKLSATATPDGAVLVWQGEEGAQFQYCVVAAGESATGWQLLDANQYQCTVSGLKAGVSYDFHVRTYCSASDQSADAKITFTPVCNAPERIELSNLTHSAATLSWQAVEGVVQYQYVCIHPDSTPSWEGVKPQDVLSVTVDTLAPNTTYAFHVRSYFSAETQSDAAKLVFTTNCVSNVLPYSESFASSGKPGCWNIANWGSSYNYWSIDSYTTRESGSYSLRYNARTGNSAAAVSPSIELSEDALLSFYYQNRYQNSYAVSFDVVVLDASNEAELYSERISSASPSNEGWAQKTIDLSAHTGRIIKVKFLGIGTGANTSCYLRIDDISIAAKPCVSPKGLKSSESSTGAVLTWTAGGDEESWNLRYRATGADEWTVIEAVSEPTYTLTGLTSGTEYEVQVQASCNAEKQSLWTGSVTFTPQCPVPTALTVSQVTDAEATVSWAGTEETYNLQYRESGAEAWIPVSGIEGTTYELKELNASTRYEVQVQSSCGGSFTGSRSFTTACAPAQGAIPFFENFEGVEGTLPECWSSRTEGDYPQVMNSASAYGADDDNRSKCLVFSGEGEQTAILPAFGDQLNGLTLSLYYKVSANSVRLQLGYLTHLYGAFQEIEELDNTVYSYEEAAHQLELKDLPADTKYLAIRYVSSSIWSSAHADNIRLETSPTTGIEATAPASHSPKRIENGVLIIEHNGAKYNATGKKL